jgi:GNAT superfamily N-acetyltransferase
MFHVDLAAVRAAFDDQMRRRVPPGPDSTVEQDERVTRNLALDGSWAAVLWSDLTADDADEVIAVETARDVPYLEWKHYSGDRPADLPARLTAAGLTPEGPETVLIADLHELDLADAAPDGVHVATVDDEAGLDALVAVHHEVFGDLHPGTRTAVLTSLSLDPRPTEAVVAWAGERPISAGRIEFSEGRDFAGLFGGGTAEDWRGRGVFRALVAHRAARARARGVRYLYVDAVPMSRPIFERLGFVQLTETTPYVGERDGG